LIKQRKGTLQMAKSKKETISKNFSTYGQLMSFIQ
jgi:hypothetical protein